MAYYDFDDPNYPYYFLLVIIAAVISFIASQPGGKVYLLVGTGLVALGIGYFSSDKRTAAITGAVFGAALVGLHYSMNFYYSGHTDLISTVVVPFGEYLVVVAALGAAFAFIGRLTRRHP